MENNKTKNKKKVARRKPMTKHQLNSFIAVGTGIIFIRDGKMFAPDFCKIFGIKKVGKTRKKNKNE